MTEWLKKLIKSNVYLYEYVRFSLSIIFRFRYQAFGVAVTAKIIKPKFLSQDFILGDYSFINSGVYIGAGVSCGNYVMFGPNVTIAGADHNFNSAGLPMYFSGRPDAVQTVIGSDVWIGADCSIKAGVTIGNGCIVAMGSLVLDDIPPYSIYGGHPARLIRPRFSSKNDIEEHEKMLLKKPQRLGKYC